MSYGDPKPQHRNAISEINEARQQALAAVSQIRQADVSPAHPHLAPATSDGHTLPIMSTQAVADYLMQLRPYRANSSRWDVDFGTVRLPGSIPGGRSNRRSGGRRPPLEIQQSKTVELTNIDQLIEALNSSIQYSTRPGASERRGPGRSKSFKFVLPPDALLKLVEMADEVAAEMDLLAEIQEPDYTAGGGDAV